MKSRTKSLLSDEQIRRLAQTHFGASAQPASITELKGGMFNSAYLLEKAGDFEKLVLKVSVAPETPILSYEKNIMAHELEVYRLIREQTTIPTPAILAQDLSRSQISQGYFFMDYLEGGTLQSQQKKIPAAELDRLKAEIAGHMAQLHKIRGSYFGYFSDEPDTRFTTWRQAWRHMMVMILEDGRRDRIKLPYERIEKVVDRHAPLLDAIREPSLVDYDLWAGNIFITNDDGQYRVEGIVDFERAFWGDPLADFASSIIMLSDIRQEPVFWKSYSETRGGLAAISEEDLIRINLYKLYLWTIMVVETYRYDFPFRQFQHAFSIALLRKFLKALEQA